MASLPNINEGQRRSRSTKKRRRSDYGVDVAVRLKVLKTEEPAGRQAGVKVKDVAELVEKLKNEAGVL